MEARSDRGGWAGRGRGWEEGWEEVGGEGGGEVGGESVTGCMVARSWEGTLRAG